MLFIQSKAYRDISDRAVGNHHWHNIMQAKETFTPTNINFSNKPIRFKRNSRLKIRSSTNQSLSPVPVDKTYQEAQTSTDISDVSPNFSKLITATKSSLLIHRKRHPFSKESLDMFQKIKVYDFKPERIQSKPRSTTPQNELINENSITNQMNKIKRKNHHFVVKSPSFSVFNVEFPRFLDNKKVPPNDWTRCSNVNSS